MNVTLPDDVTDGERSVRVWEETRDDRDVGDSAAEDRDSGAFSERFPSRWTSPRVARVAARPTTPPKTLARAFPLSLPSLRVPSKKHDPRPPACAARATARPREAWGAGRRRARRAGARCASRTKAARAGVDAQRRREGFFFTFKSTCSEHGTDVFGARVPRKIRFVVRPRERSFGSARRAPRRRRESREGRQAGSLRTRRRRRRALS